MKVRGHLDKPVSSFRFLLLLKWWERVRLAVNSDFYLVAWIWGVLRLNCKRRVFLFKSGDINDTASDGPLTTNNAEFYTILEWL